MADKPAATGDRRSGGEYYRLALGSACQAFAAMGDWTSVHRYRADLVAHSVLDPTGRHLDALVAALLERVHDTAKAEQYRDMCDPWTDTFFDESRWRR